MANDLGASNIVDADFTATTAILTARITGNCICYQHENLVDKLNQLVAGGAGEGKGNGGRASRYDSSVYGQGKQ